MTPMIELLTDYGGMLLAGSSVLLGIGTIATAIFGRPVLRQRLGELALAATMAWLLLACVPLPRWDIGANESLASSGGDTYRIGESRVGTRGSLDEPSSNFVADAPVGVLAVGEGLEELGIAAQGGTKVQPSASSDFFGATVVSTVESSPVRMESRVGWRRTLAVSYSVGVVGCVIWLLAGHVLLARTERLATAPDEWLENLYDSVTNGRGVKRARLLVSKGCRRPAVYGFWRPVIILPWELCRAENSEQLRHVLRHESAHVWRGDARGNLIMNAAFPALFFHPLFWWIRHRIQFSRELIADDWAAGLSSRESYADELVQLVSQGRGMRLGTIGVLGVFRFNTPFYRRMKMLIDRRQPLATTLPLTWKLLGILAGVMVVAAMACVSGVPRVAAEGDPPATAAEEPNPDITDEPVASGQASGGGGMSDASSPETEARQSLDEAIRAALKDVPDATIQIVRDPKTGGVSVRVGVPAEHFSRVWMKQQRKTREGSRRDGKELGGGMMGGTGAGSGMMGGGMMGKGQEDEEVSGGGGRMGVAGMGVAGMDEDAKEMGMGGMGMGSTRRGGMGMGGGGGFGSRIPKDQLNKVQTEETDNIRDTVTALLRKTELDAEPNASVDVSVVRDIRLDSCVVTLIDDVAIPARAEGPVVELAIREGDRVKRGQILARIDDRRARLKLEEAKGFLEEAQGKDLDVRYAQTSADATSADHKQALEINEGAPGTFPEAEIRRLAMESDLARIRVEQAKRAMVGIRAQEVQLALAESELSDYRTQAPLDGIVVKVFPHVGEWVKSGDPICRIVRMDRLRVESRLDVSRYSPDEVHGSDVIIEVKSVRGKVERMPGKVTFVSPLGQDGSGSRVVAEVSNRSRDGRYLLRPGGGWKVTMVVKLASRPGGR
jgi:beta-lactamase regulating signal transducer with metallopeptidase domain/biotin carboxyl carrier protein